jgi:hypothetical protein
MREGVFNVHNSHLWARDNPHAIRKCGYQVCFSVSVSTGIVGDIVMGPYLLPDRLTVQYHDYLKTLLSGLLEDVPLAVRPVVASERWSSSAVRGRCPAVVERHISRKVD